MLIDEWCSNCEEEVTVEWDVEKDGYIAECPACSKSLKLCSMCRHIRKVNCRCSDYGCDAEQNWDLKSKGLKK